MATIDSIVRYQSEPHVDPEISQFISDFFAVSDAPGKHDEYVNHFMGDATFILGSKRSVGCDEIRKTRESMWTHVSGRRHLVHEVFITPTTKVEVMFHGNVTLTFKNDTEAVVDWSARADLARGADRKYKMKFYQVYLDTSGIQAYQTNNSL